MKKKAQTNKKLLFGGGVAISFVAVLATLFSNFSANAAPESTIYLSPSEITVENGEVFSIEARIDPASNEVTAVDMRISFDSTMLQLSNMTNGTAFPSVLQSAQIDNETGQASIIVGVQATDPPSPVTTDQVVANLMFEVIGEGSSVVAFTDQTVASALGESSNVIITRTPAQVTAGTGVPVKTYGISDFTVLVNDWLTSTSSSLADVNEDGRVDSRDLGIMMTYWQN